MISYRGLENSQQLFSRVCVCVLFVSGFCCFCFSRANTLILGTPKDCNMSIEFTRSITEGMGVVLCKDS
jgi:hypothetical protein